MANAWLGDAPVVKLNSASGYIHSKPGYIVGMNVSPGSTVGNWRIRDGSTGAIVAISGFAATTPARAGTIPYHCAEGLIFKNYIYAKLTGGAQSVLQIRFFRRASD